MIWLVTKKEFYQNLITFRFIVGTILMILLVVIISWIQIEEYYLKMEAYNYSLQQNETYLKNVYVYSEIRSIAIKPPEIMSIFCGGVSKKLDGIAEIMRQEVPFQTAAYLMDNPLLRLFQSIDMVLVFKLIMSLMALLFAFDLFCGEKEDGTLKLMLSGRVSRAQLFAGKIYGGLLSLAVISLLGIFMSMLVLILSPNVAATGEVSVRILMIFIITLVYVSAFYTIGALVSTLTHRSATSLTMSLFIWVVLVVGLPNLANYTAERLKPIESLKMINEKVEALREEFEEKLDAYTASHPEPEGGTVISGTTNETDGFYRFRKANLNQFKYYRHFIPFSENLRLEYADKIFSVRQNYQSTLKQQADFVTQFSIYSPVRLYECLTSILARTDIVTHIDFLNQARMYRNQMLDYFHAKNAFRVTRFFSIMTEAEAPDVTSASVFQDGSEGARIWEQSNIEWEERPLLSLDDFPRFIHHPESIGISLQRASLLFCALLLLNLVLLAGGYWGFMKYDVR